MKAKAKTAVYHNGKRYEKDDTLNIKQEHFNADLFESLETPGKANDTKDEASEVEE